MDFWLIQEGEKIGPIHDYEVRERIERGELDRKDRVWQEGQDGWLALEDMELFRNSFEEETVPVPAVPPPLPNRPRPLVRFWARWFDFLLYGTLVFGVIRWSGMNPHGAVASPVFMVTWLLPWLLLEAIAVHLWKTTPGKWLLAVEVQKPGGARLAPVDAMLRTMRAYILGLGMMLWIFPIFGQGFGLWYTRRFGEAPWDRMAGNEVRVGAQTGPKIVVFAILFGVLLFALPLLMGSDSDPKVVESWRELLRQIRETYPGIYE